jgi:hypothetical protein
MILRILLLAVCPFLVLAGSEANAVPVVVIAPGADGDLGTVHGRRLAGPARMIAPLGLRHPAALALTAERRAAMLAAVPERFRIEMASLAVAAGVEESAIVGGNLLADSLCSALVAAPEPGRPLRVARNMDYAPPELLGPATVIQVVHPPGRRAFAAVGWPGMVAVISGMNADGLSVCLLQHHGRGAADGLPVAFAARVLLEEASTVDEALAILAGMRLATGHFLLLADPRGAVAVHQDAGALHRLPLAGAHLALDNAGAHGDRAGALAAAARGGIPADDGWLRSVLRHAPIPGLNAQAMVLIPARREIQLAVAAGPTAAVDAPWWRYDLAPLLAGGATVAAVTPLGRAP